MNLKSRLSSFAFAAFFLSISLIGAANAAEQVVASVVTDDPAASTYKLIIDSSNDGREIKKFYKDVYSRGVKVRRDVLDPVVLVQRGLILEQRGSHLLMVLRSNNFDFQQGGYITIDTLYNGATGERRGYDVQIAQGQTHWNMFSKGRAIKEISIQTHRIFLLGAVGIKNLVIR